MASRYFIVNTLRIGSYVLIPFDLDDLSKKQNASGLYEYLKNQRKNGKAYSVRSSEGGWVVRRVK